MNSKYGVSALVALVVLGTLVHFAAFPLAPQSLSRRAVSTSSSSASSSESSLSVASSSSVSSASSEDLAPRVVVFTSDCSTYSDWQVYGAVHSLRAVDPSTYRIVRLVSCNAGIEGVSGMQRRLPGEMRVSTQIGDPYPHPPIKGFVYPPLNKPYAIVDWLFNGTGSTLPDNAEIVIVDVDSLFLRPLDWGASSLGKPAASNQYFMGSDWLVGHDSEVAHYCGDKCKLPADVIARKYDVGAPYYVRAADLRRLAPLWWDYTHRIVLDSDPNRAWSMPGGWICEMYAYVMAAIECDLPHTGLPGSMAHVGDHLLVLPSNVDMPGIIHYCQIYNLTLYDESHTAYFSKHDWHQRSVMDCALLKNPGDEYHFMKNHPFNPPLQLTATEMPKRKKTTRGERELFMLWSVYHRLGAAVKHFNETECASS